MRKLARSVARHMFERKGYSRLNRKSRDPGTKKKASFFSMNWRRVVQHPRLKAG